MNHERRQKHEREEEAAHWERFALPLGGIRCKRGKRMKEAAHRDGSPYLVEMPVVGRDERPRSSAVELGDCLRMGNGGWLKPPTPEEGFLPYVVDFVWGFSGIGEQKL